MTIGSAVQTGPVELCCGTDPPPGVCGVAMQEQLFGGRGVTTAGLQEHPGGLAKSRVALGIDRQRTERLTDPLAGRLDVGAHHCDRSDVDEVGDRNVVRPGGECDGLGTQRLLMGPAEPFDAGGRLAERHRHGRSRSAITARGSSRLSTTPGVIASQAQALVSSHPVPEHVNHGDHILLDTGIQETGQRRVAIQRGMSRWIKSRMSVARSTIRGSRLAATKATCSPTRASPISTH